METLWMSCMDRLERMKRKWMGDNVRKDELLKEWEDLLFGGRNGWD